jgi:hypothetical protein
MRGSLVGLALGGAAGVTVLVVVGVVLVRGCGGDQGAPAAAHGPDQATLAGEQGMSAKGTVELRAQGCTNAVVVDMQRVMGASSTIRPNEPRYMVTCDVASAASTPTCEKLASTYFAALGGSSDANVCIRVSVVGSPKPACSRLFAPSGADLGPFPR